MQRFAREFEITAETRVLDVGGTPETWDTLAVRPPVTLLNTPRTKPELASASWWVVGDGRALPFRDCAFDVVFSNSVIEHVGDDGSQRRFAGEVARVGRAYWVQTPNRWFPMEQHLLTPASALAAQAMAALDCSAVHRVERAGAPVGRPAGVLCRALSGRGAAVERRRVGGAVPGRPRDSRALVRVDQIPGGSAPSE